MKTIRGLTLVTALTACISAPVSSATIIDHTCADLDAVPSSWIETVQDDIPSHYAHTSHGSQLTWGLSFIESSDPFYDCEIGSCYLPSVPNAWCIFDGQESQTYITPDLYWETGTGMNLTRDVLDNNPSLETSMWCWCTQCDYYSQSQVEAYLDSMAVLESEYPGVTFIYFTGNAQGTGSAGYNRWLRNQQIRDFCSSGDRILYDFADLDCWWYNPGTSSWEQHTYPYNGYDVPAEHPQFYGDQYGHTTAESCTQKGEALWYMMAVIAGWSGTGISVEEPGQILLQDLACINPATGSIRLSFTLSSACDVSVDVFSCDGRLVHSDSEQDVQAGPHDSVICPSGNGLYLCLVRAGDETAVVTVAVIR